MEVRCPQCHSPIELADDTPLSEIACPSCGSSFSLLGDETLPHQAAQIKTIGHFELVDQIGVGSFGSVWKARDTELDRTVAVKIPRKGQLDPAETEQFLREARAAAQLRHPNIVSVHEVGREEDTAYIVSDYIEGLTLADWLTDQRLTAREAAELCVKTADALHHAHQAGVIHRDLKPGNIVLDAAGEPHIMDFGLAKREAGEITMTIEGKVLGTPAYMSPEQAKGEAHQADRRSDVYSLGVILFELLTGERPFRGNMRMLLHHVVHDDAPSPRRIDSSVPRDLETICLKCLEKDPQKRYLTAEELAEELRRFLCGEPIHARPITVAARTWRWCKRNPMGATVAALLLFLAVAGPLAAMNQTRLAGSESKARKNAEDAADRAIQAERTARDQAEQRRQQLYVSDLAMAQREFNELDTQRAGEILKKHIPNLGETDLRGFEWRWLWNQCHQGLFELRGHSTILRDLKFSPDGKWLASGSMDGTARLWNLETQQEVWQWDEGEGVDCNTVDFSPDGKLLVTVFGLGANSDVFWDAILWNVTDPSAPTEVCRFRAKGRLCFAPDGETLWAGEKQYDLAGKLIREFEPAGPSDGQSFSTDGRTFVSMNRSATGRIWDVPSGRLLASLEKHKGWADYPTKGVAISPVDDDVIVTVCLGKARIWNRAGKEVCLLPGLSETVLSMVGFSRDGKLLAVRKFHGAIAIFETETWTQIATWRTAMGNTLAFSPKDDDFLVAGDVDGVIRGWSVASTDPVFDHPGPIVSVKFSPDGRLLAVGMKRGAVRFWDIPSKTELFTTPDSREKDEPMYFWSSFSGDFFAFSPDSSHAAIIGPENAVTVWNIETAEPLPEFKNPKDLDYWSIAFTPEGNGLVAGLRDGGVIVWDWEDRETMSGPVTKPPLAGVKSLAVSADGRTLVTGQEAEVKVWDLRNMQLLRTLPLLGEHDGLALSFSFSKDGSRLAVGVDCCLHTIIWDTNTWRQIPLPHHSPNHVAFSAEGDRLAASDMNSRTKLWDLETQQPIAAFRGSVVEFSHDGTMLAIGSPTSLSENRQLDGRVTLYLAPPLAQIDGRRAEPVVERDFEK